MVAFKSRAFFPLKKEDSSETRLEMEMDFVLRRLQRQFPQRRRANSAENGDESRALKTRPVVDVSAQTPQSFLLDFAKRTRGCSSAKRAQRRRQTALQLHPDLRA